MMSEAALEKKLEGGEVNEKGKALIRALVEVSSKGLVCCDGFSGLCSGPVAGAPGN